MCEILGGEIMEKEIKKLMQEFEYMLEEEPEKILKFTKKMGK